MDDGEYSTLLDALAGCQTVNPNDGPSLVEKYETSWVDVLEYRTNGLCGQVVGMRGFVDREEGVPKCRQPFI